MKWLFISLLIANVLYLGWEINNDTRAKVLNSSPAVTVPKGLKPLYLISELEQLPEAKPGSDTDNNTDTDVRENPAKPAELMDIESFSDNTALDDSANTKSEFVKAQPDEAGSLPQTACFAYGPLLDPDEAERLAAWFLRRSISIDRRKTEEKKRRLFRMHLAPRESTTVAIEAMQDLITKGVKDARLISRGDLKNAISLGLFFSQTEVNERLAEIKGKGYQPVVVPHYGQNTVHWIDVSIDKNDAVLTEMFSSLPSRYNSVAINCTDAANSG